MKNCDFLKIVKKKDNINFIITTKDEYILKDILNEIANEIKTKKIENANVIVCTDASQFIND